MAVEAGADEIDIVLALNSFMAGDEESARKEIRAIRAAIDEAAAKAGRKVTLKVILETGLLVTPENIANASFLAMEEGADFIKTSTGKVSVNATPMALLFDRRHKRVGQAAHSETEQVLVHPLVSKDGFHY